jgi:hypothetical protein
VNFVSVVNNEIFYSVDRQNNEYEPGIYKISLDGTNNVQLISGNCAYITVSECWIYFTIREEGGFILYKMRADGKELTKLCEDDVQYPNPYKGWIYYSKDDGIYKIRIDGTDKLKIGSKVGWNINIDNDWIYYVDVSNINTKNLFKMSLDGTKVVNLQKGPVCNISLMGEWMTVSFSCGEGEGYETYVMKRDGSCKRLISPNPYSRYK